MKIKHIFYFSILIDNVVSLNYYIKQEGKNIIFIRIIWPMFVVSLLHWLIIILTDYVYLCDICDIYELIIFEPKIS